MIFALLAAAAVAVAPAPSLAPTNPQTVKPLICTMQFVDNLRRPAVDPSTIVDEYLNTTKLSDAEKAAYRHDCDMFQMGAVTILKMQAADRDAEPAEQPPVVRPGS